MNPDIGAVHIISALFQLLLYAGTGVALLLVLSFIGYTAFAEKGRRSMLLALRSLRLHKLRSMLSVLGIIIGTSAVIALMAFGKGSMEDALEDIRRQGTTNIIVRSVKPMEETAAKSRSWVANY